MAIKAEKPGSQPRKIADGGGLHLLINPNGNKLWRFSYRFGGKQKTMAMGVYPATSLKEARDKRDDAKKLLEKGVDPSVQRKEDKLFATADRSFKTIAEELIEKYQTEGSAPKTIKKMRWILSLVYPDIGSLQIEQITPPMLLASLRKIEAKKRYESARRCRSTCGQVLRYAIATGRGGRDLSFDLRDALITPQVKHRATIVDPAKIGGLLRAIDGYDGTFTTKLALRLAPLVFVRPGELRHAEWPEFSIETEWRIPAEKMKMRRPHRVPLSRQAREIIREVKEIGINSRYLFPSVRSNGQPMSENTVTAALRRMGYSGDEMTGHGFRGMASTLLNEMGKWNPDAIERQLAHVEGNDARKAYIHLAEFWDERVQMMQAWAGYLDRLRDALPTQVLATE
ncbi:MAG: tyrosine-type recombinase/integrase [Rhodospirillaceae bacterium]